MKTTQQSINWLPTDICLTECTHYPSQQARTQELETILEIANNNGFPESIIEKLHDRIRRKLTSNNISTHANEIEGIKKKRAIFHYHTPVIRKITNLFQNTDIQVVFKTPNTIFKLLQDTQRIERYNRDGIYGIKT